MIVVTTPTGQIGRGVVRRLLDGGGVVRVVARDQARLSDIADRVEIVQGSHDDPAVLDRALPGADALFWLVPPDPAAPSALEHYLAFARAGSAAIARHGTGHVVGVSSAGHGWPQPAGVLSAAFAMDAELETSGAAYRALSMPFYLENLLAQVDGIRDDGEFALTAAPDRPLPCIAVADIATVAAGLLLDRSWAGQADLPVFGPDRVTPEQLAAVMTEVLDRPVRYRFLGPDDFASVLAARGASVQTIRDMADMVRAQTEGIYADDWAAADPTSTDVRTWCEQVLAPAVRGRS